MERNDKGRAFLWGFFAIDWRLSLLGYPQREWVWSTNPLKEQKGVKNVLSFMQYHLLKKHFRVTKISELPDKNSLEYHPLQNILREYLKAKSYIDEGRVTSKSKRNKFKIRNQTSL